MDFTHLCVSVCIMPVDHGEGLATLNSPVAGLYSSVVHEGAMRRIFHSQVPNISNTFLNAAIRIFLVHENHVSAFLVSGKGYRYLLSEFTRTDASNEQSVGD
jgi:hypothetical protein